MELPHPNLLRLAGGLESAPCCEQFASPGAQYRRPLREMGMDSSPPPPLFSGGAALFFAREMRERRIGEACTQE
ncbi:hypothetical protein PAHAL_1G435900 [Panicum hallii]|uniref:Uncharacterized protein n=1 Tax=Panicum hallii TaxID=206008 RepID=A0A2T8KYC8_9POAL|nr:hypothetical protein PAHAL_1G435900 [Panicum hallii]